MEHLKEPKIVGKYSSLEVNWAEVDSKYYTSIEQGLVLLKDAKNSSEAKAFYDFLRSEKAKEILHSFGYIVK